MKNICITAVALAAIAPIAAHADSIATENPYKVSRLEFVRTSAQDKKDLQEARQPEARNIPAPNFAVKSTNGNFIMAVGGMINPIMGYDIGNNLYSQGDAGISFVTSAIPVPAQKGKKGDFYINPINGFVDLSIVGLKGTKNQITGYAKIGTDGVTPGILLQRAYISWRNWTAGQKLTLAQDAYACQPPTIDPEGPSGCVSNVAYEIAYQSPSYKGFSWAAALDMPTFYSSNGYYRGKDYPIYDGKQVANYADAEQLIPDIPAWIQYQGTNMWNRVRLTGILRNFAYRDLLTGKVRYTQGWGAMLSGNLQPAKPIILYYQLAYGKGIGAYLQDIAGKPLSFIPKDDAPGKMEATPMMGANIGITYNVNSKLQFNAMFSESRIWDVETYANSLPESQNYKYALYGAVNCFYNITPYLQWGVEYLWGHRQTWNIGGAHDNRIQTQLAFSF